MTLHVASTSTWSGETVHVVTPVTAMIEIPHATGCKNKLVPATARESVSTQDGRLFDPYTCACTALIYLPAEHASSWDSEPIQALTRAALGNVLRGRHHDGSERWMMVGSTRSDINPDEVFYVSVSSAENTVAIRLERAEATRLMNALMGVLVKGEALS